MKLSRPKHKSVHLHEVYQVYQSCDTFSIFQESILRVEVLFLFAGVPYCTSVLLLTCMENECTQPVRKLLFCIYNGQIEIIVFTRPLLRDLDAIPAFGTATSWRRAARSERRARCFVGQISTSGDGWHIFEERGIRVEPIIIL